MPLRVLGAQGGTSYDIIQAVRYAARLPRLRHAARAARRHNQSEPGRRRFFPERAGRIHRGAESGVITLLATGSATRAVVLPTSNAPGCSRTRSGGIQPQGPAYGIPAPRGRLRPAGCNGRCQFRGFRRDTEHVPGAAIPCQHQTVLSRHLHGRAAYGRCCCLDEGRVSRDHSCATRSGSLPAGKLPKTLATRAGTIFSVTELIDALKAVQRAQDLAGEGSSLPVLTVTPTALNFGFSGARHGNLPSPCRGAQQRERHGQRRLAYGNRLGLGPYAVSVNDAGLVTGAYSAKITFTSNANPVTIPVTMQVGSPGAGNAGFHYILLYDPVADSSAYQDTAAASGGMYGYSIGGVAAGNYYVIAGSDLDNDNSICDPGEACGAYPTFDLPTILNTSTSNLTGIDFTTGFASAIGAQSTQPQSQRGYRRISPRQDAH